MKKLALTLLLILWSVLSMSEVGAPGRPGLAEAPALDARFTRVEFQPDNVSTMVDFSAIVGRVEVRADAADMRVVGERREFVLRGSTALSLPVVAVVRGIREIPLPIRITSPMNSRRPFS